MITILKARELIENEISNFKLPNEPADLYDPVKYILEFGGKRLRPVMVMLGCDLYDGDLSLALKAAVAVEIFHNFTLVHDDLMDNALLRRNKETIHTKWGTDTAILSGDAMQIIACQIMTEISTPNLIKILQIFNHTALHVCEGQQFDMDFEQRLQITTSEYLNMIRLKTAVLLAASLKIGALIADAPEPDYENLYEFGLNLGMAFQLQDDLLDVFADENCLGKEIGKDIVSNKKTYLFIKFFEVANQGDINYLKSIIQENTISPSAKIKIFTELYLKYKIPEKTNELILEYFNKASSILADLHVPENRLHVLEELLNIIKIRVN